MVRYGDITDNLRWDRGVIMSWTKLTGLLVVLSLNGCKSTEAAGAKAAEELKNTIDSVAGDTATAQKLPLKESSPVLMQWKYGRLSLSLKNDEAVEVQDKPGRVVCEITEAVVRGALGDAKLEELKKAIKVLAENKGSTRRNPMFRAYDESRELVAYSDGEFVIEAMYQAQEVLSPKVEAKRAEFQGAYDVAISVARDAKVCPKLD